MRSESKASATKAQSSSPKGKLSFKPMGRVPAVEMRETESVTGVVLPEPGDAGLGLNAHCVLVGRLWQANMIEPEKLAVPEALRLNVAGAVNVSAPVDAA